MRAFNGDIIKKWMEHRKFSKKKTAEYCGISVATLNKLLLGKTNVRITNAIKLVKALKISLDLLLKIKY